jgi:hypothetical protein
MVIVSPVPVAEAGFEIVAVVAFVTAVMWVLAGIFVPVMG